MIELKTMALHRFGEERASYRYPIVVSDALDLVYYQASGGPAIQAMNIATLASREWLSYFAAYRDPQGRVTFMPIFEPSSENAFIAFPEHERGNREFYKRYDSFSMFPGLGQGEVFGEVHFFHGDAFRLSEDGKTRISSFDEIVKTTVIVSGGRAVAAERQNVDHLSTLETLKQNETITMSNDFTGFEEVQICLELAQIK